MDARVTITYQTSDGSITNCNLEKGNSNNVSEHYEKNLIEPRLNRKKGAYVQGSKFKYGFIGNRSCGVFGVNGYYGYNSGVLSGTTPTSSGFENMYEFPVDQKPTFVISGKDITNFVVIFDCMGEEYAPRITITVDKQAVEYENHRSIFLHEFESAVQTFKLTFESWNMPANFAKVSKISTIFSRSYESDKIISFSASRENRSNHSGIEFGAASQYGSVEFFNEGEFTLLNEYELLQGDLDVAIAAKGAVDFVPIGCYKSESWSISENETSVKLNLTDALDKLNDRKIDMFNLNQINELRRQESSATVIAESIPLEALIKRLLKIGGLANLEVRYNSSIDRLQAEWIEISDLFLEKGSVQEMLKRLLQSAKMRLYIGAEHDAELGQKPVAVLYKA